MRERDFRNMTKIQEILFKHQDKKYKAFHSALIPTVNPETVIGVRVPEYKIILKEIEQDAGAAAEVPVFLKSLPHKYYEENILHTKFICKIKDFDECVENLELFLPFADNWAVTDGIKPKAFEKNHEKLGPKVAEWIKSDLPYTKRTGMLFVMKYFLGKEFRPEFLELAAEIKSDEYYVNMMRAWLFAEALVKHWDAAFYYIKNNRLDVWTHNKTIQKARESFRITTEQKELLKTFRR